MFVRTTVELSTTRDNLDPIFVSVKEAARAVNVSPWTMYQLLDAQEVEGRYQGRRRLVVVESLREYARNLPNERPDTVA